MIGADTTPEEVCLQTLNMKNDGKVTISLYEKDVIIKTKEIDIQPGNPDIHCHDFKLPPDFQDKYTVLGIRIIRTRERWKY